LKAISTTGRAAKYFEFFVLGSAETGQSYCHGDSYWLPGGALLSNVALGITQAMLLQELSPAGRDGHLDNPKEIYIALLPSYPKIRATLRARTLHNLPQNPPWSCPECGVGLGWDGSNSKETTGIKVVDINNYRWAKYCRGLFELPVAV
jgi:hypothetical protein